MNTKSVRFRTTVGGALALACLLLIAGFAINWLVGREISQSFDATLLEQAGDRARLLDAGAPASSLMNVVGDEVIVVALDPNGSVIASAGSPTPQDVVGLPPGLSNAELTIFEAGETDQGIEAPHAEKLRVAVAAASDGSRIVVGNEGESVRSAQSTVRNVLFAGVPLAALAAAAIGWFVTGRALQPVKSIERDLGQVLREGLDHRIAPAKTGDEIAELASSINQVLDRLDEQSEARRQFVADASHELKSPIANARVLIDTAEPHDFDRVTEAVTAELSRLQLLVDDLLYLAREDESAPRAPLPFDLDDIVFDEAERTRRSTPIALDASRVEPARVQADPNEVRRAIRNLIENAVRFAASRVSLSIRAESGTVTCVVDDDGPGIPPHARDRVFERFARLDADRARSDGGTGLGLAIVASIAERNGGVIRVGASASGGARFELDLPAANQS